MMLEMALKEKDNELARMKQLVAMKQNGAGRVTVALVEREWLGHSMSADTVHVFERGLQSRPGVQAGSSRT